MNKQARELFVGLTYGGMFGIGFISGALVISIFVALFLF